MRKRLRKKLHLKEFQELGFEIWFKMKSILNVEDHNQFWDDFIEEAIEANGLAFGGGFGPEEGEGQGFVVTSPGRGSATDEHRVIMQEWLMNHPEIEKYRVDQLRDAWYGGD